MAEPFSTNELFLRSDRISFGKVPPEVPERTEQTLILPDLTGSKLYFGLSSLVSTSGLTGTLEAIYPQFASFTFDNLNKRLGINVSTPQYAIDISTTTGVRVVGGPLIAEGQGLVSVPTAALFSTLPTYVFAPGTIPPTAIASTGALIPGLSVPTSALFGTLPTALFAPSTIPLASLQSSGVIIASSFVGDGYFLSNIPLANINGTVTGDFFRPNSIPLSTLASTGQIWIREPTGSIFAPIMSTGQFFASSIQANNISSINFQAANVIVSTIRANTFESDVFGASNLSAINIKASSIQVLQLVSSARFSGDGQFITNLTPAFLNNVIPSDKFGYRLIAFDAINPYGNFLVIAGSATFYQAVPVVVQGIITASTFQGGYFRGDGGGLSNLPLTSTIFSFQSSLIGLGTLGYVSTTQLTSSIEGLGSVNYVSSTQVASTVIGLATAGYVSSTQLASTVQGLGSANYISSSQLISSVEGLIRTHFDTLEVQSTLQGLGTYGYVSTLSLTSSLLGLGSIGFVSSLSLTSSLEGVGTLGYVSSASLISSLEGLGTLNYVSTLSLVSTTDFFRRAGFLSTLNLTSTVQGLGSAFYVSSSQLASTVEGLGSASYISSLSLTSTVIGLGTVNYISTLSLVSTTQGLQSYISSFIDPTELASTILSTVTGVGLQSNLTSTVQGLGSAGYVSTLSLVSTTQGLQTYISSFIDPTELASTILSTVAGVGLQRNFTSTVQGLGSAGYVSTLSLVSTTQGLQSYISSFIDPTELASTVTSTVLGLGLDSRFTSTVQGLGSSGYVSTLTLNAAISSFSTAIGPASGGIDPTTLNSTVRGLGTSGYISSLSLTSSLQGLGTSGYISSLSLTSSLQGLGTFGYVSTSTLYAAISSLSTAYGIIGSLVGIPSTISTFAVLTSSITASTIQARVVSTFSFFTSSINNDLPFTLLTGISTVAGLGTYGYISSLQLRSTVAGLGSASYVSTLSLTSSMTAVGTFISTLSTSYRNQFNTVNAIISALTVSSLTFGTGDGFLSMPDIRPTAMSTLVTQTSSLATFNLQIGATSSVTAIQFYGLQGNFNNTVLAERSIAPGSQEFLIFKGSSTQDQIRFQTTGIFEIETGVSSRLWSSVTQNAIPSFVIDINSNVGIKTAAPGATLDVVGSVRSQSMSTQQFQFSSLSGFYGQGNIVSSVQLTASSIFATLAGPLTLVLYDL